MKRLSLAIAYLTVAVCAVTGDDGVRSFLKGFVARYSNAEVDFFYVAPAKKGQFSDSVWIYWMTGNALLFVDIPTERLKDYERYDRKSKIRLATDVVPTSDDIQGSNYLAEAKFVEGILRECLSSGRKIIVKKTEANKSPEATTLARTPAADAPVAPAVGRASS